jgi:hypothetical protein
MAPKSRRIVVPLDDTAGEALSALSQWLGLGEDALAKRLLSATLNVIAGCLEARQESGEAPESEAGVFSVPRGEVPWEDQPLPQNPYWRSSGRHG